MAGYTGPEDFNLYTYVQNSPLKYTDPLGLAGVDWVLIVIVLLLALLTLILFFLYLWFATNGFHNRIVTSSNSSSSGGGNTALASSYPTSNFQIGYKPGVNGFDTSTLVYGYDFGGGGGGGAYNGTA